MPNLTQEQAKQAIAAAVEGLSGLAASAIYLDYIDTARPSGDHIQITVSGESALSYVEQITASTVVQQRLIRVDLNAYGESTIGAGAVSALHRVAALLISDDADARALYTAGVHPQSVGEVLDLTTAMGTAHEPRAYLAVSLAYRRLWSSDEPASATTITVDLATRGGSTADADDVITETTL